MQIFQYLLKLKARYGVSYERPFGCMAEAEVSQSTTDNGRRANGPTSGGGL